MIANIKILVKNKHQNFKFFLMSLNLRLIKINKFFKIIKSSNKKKKDKFIIDNLLFENKNKYLFIMIKIIRCEMTQMIVVCIRIHKQ